MNTSLFKDSSLNSNEISFFLQPIGFETLLNKEMLRFWIRNTWHQSVTWSVLYILIIFVGKMLMKYRQPFDLKRVMLAWNLILAIFSISATLRLIPWLYLVINTFGYHYTICDNKIVEDIPCCIFWGWLFYCSKVIELGDTIFIVLRKHKLLFLHWYHHVVTLVFTWYSVVREVSIGPWFVINNCAVHSFMYTYFAVKVMGVKIPRYIAMLITTLQVIQMFYGVFITVWAYWTIKNGKECRTPLDHIHIAFAVYFSYFLLFGNLFYRSYIYKRITWFKVDKIQ